MILQNHRRLPVSIFSVISAAIGSLKRVIGRIFKLVSNFKDASKFLIFSSTKKQKIVKLSAYVHYRKYLFIIISL
jgi:hypothetical protein